MKDLLDDLEAQVARVRNNGKRRRLSKMLALVRTRKALAEERARLAGRRAHTITIDEPPEAA